jgi:hypothetical protein
MMRTRLWATEAHRADAALILFESADVSDYAAAGYAIAG